MTIWTTVEANWLQPPITSPRWEHIHRSLHGIVFSVPELDSRIAHLVGIKVRGFPDHALDPTRTSDHLINGNLHKKRGEEEMH